jgi:hypothetical protein
MVVVLVVDLGLMGQVCLEEVEGQKEQIQLVHLVEE